MNRAIVNASRVAPGTSIRERSRVGLAGTPRNDSTNPSAPAAAVTANIQRQEKRSASTGAVIVVRTLVAANRIMNACSAEPTRSFLTCSDASTTERARKIAEAPLSARKTISDAMFGEQAAPIDVTAKRTRVPCSRGFRPN